MASLEGLEAVEQFAANRAARLEERAARIKDLEWRDELLRSVPTHARILELARGR